MEAYSPQADLLRAISHPIRLAVLEILRDGEQCVCHMEATLGLRQASISQHLMTLREAGLVEVRRDGNNIYYRVLVEQLFDVLDAVYAATGRPKPRLTHKHGKANCPCPKCNAVQHISLNQLSVQGSRHHGSD